jgi:hypothetical protein
MLKPKYIDEWKLDKKSKREVKKQLKIWIDKFGEDNVSYEVRKDDFKNNDIFYFTDCIDILSKNPESKGVEDNQKIKKRKERVLLHLFLRKMICDDLDIPQSRCTHCGFTPLDIYNCEDGYGYFHFCPKCFNIILVTYPSGIVSSGNFVLHKLEECADKYVGNKND